MVNLPSQSKEVGQVIGAAREAERVFLDHTADVVSVSSDVLLGQLPHGAPCTALSKVSHVLKEFDILPHAGVPSAAATQQVLGRKLTLQVFIQGARVGDLCKKGGVWSFCYARRWANDANHCALAPGIPLQNKPIVDIGTMRPVQRYFESLLPDERERMSHAALARVDAVDSFSLLAYCGAKSASYHLGDYPDFIQFGSTQNKLA